MNVSFYDIDEKLYVKSISSMSHIPRIGECVDIGSHSWHGPTMYRVTDVCYSFIDDQEGNDITIYIKLEE